MSVVRWCFRHIILIWGLLIFVDGLAVWLLDLQYDAGGLEGLANILFGLLGLPVFLAGWLLIKLGMAVQDPSTQYAALALGLILCVIVDMAIQTLLRRRHGGESGRERPGSP